MIETVVTERNGERQSHEDVEIPIPDNVTIHGVGGYLNVTLTGTRAEMKRFLKDLAAALREAAK